MAGLGSGVTFNVKTEDLVAKSSEVSKKVSKMATHFENIKDLVDKTKAYWQGEAGDKHRQLYTDLVPEVDEILKRLAEHPVDLVAIAQQYSDVELKIQQDIEALPNDVLV